MSLMMTAVEEASFRFQTSLNKSLDDNSAIAGPSEDQARLFLQNE
jgi:hypothetical protein